MFNKIKNKLIYKVNIVSEAFNKKQWIILIVLFVLSIIIGK
tara:strand:- start:343 stop:465 length:123 start_codon:yes stop_codon:yes gene_type:complete